MLTHREAVPLWGKAVFSGLSGLLSVLAIAALLVSGLLPIDAQTSFGRLLTRFDPHRWWLVLAIVLARSYFATFKAIKAYGQQVQGESQSLQTKVTELEETLHQREQGAFLDPEGEAALKIVAESEFARLSLTQKWILQALNQHRVLSVEDLKTEGRKIWPLAAGPDRVGLDLANLDNPASTDPLRLFVTVAGPGDSRLVIHLLYAKFVRSKFVAS